MAKYALQNASTASATAITTTFITLLAVHASTGGSPRRGKLYDLLIGTNGTPADNFMTWDVSRKTTTTGVFGAGNTVALDEADPTSSNDGKIDYSTEPTITSSSSLFAVGVNKHPVGGCAEHAVLPDEGGGRGPVVACRRQGEANHLNPLAGHVDHVLVREQRVGIFRGGARAAVHRDDQGGQLIFRRGGQAFRKAPGKFHRFGLGAVIDHRLRVLDPC